MPNNTLNSILDSKLSFFLTRSLNKGNVEPVIPEILGIDRFRGRVVHTGVYKSSSNFRNQRVLVIGCGNFGMEVSLELCRLGSRTFSPSKASYGV